MQMNQFNLYKLYGKEEILTCLEMGYQQVSRRVKDITVYC